MAAMSMAKTAIFNLARAFLPSVCILSLSQVFSQAFRDILRFSCSQVDKNRDPPRDSRADMAYRSKESMNETDKPPL
ncbi:hypothetical protein NL676_012866 [Syzygium grande]|nr:hypothetical protein NL676_012866 [Syzygium grande]